MTKALSNCDQYMMLMRTLEAERAAARTLGKTLSAAREDLYMHYLDSSWMTLTDQELSKVDEHVKTQQAAAEAVLKTLEENPPWKVS